MSIHDGASVVDDRAPDGACPPDVEVDAAEDKKPSQTRQLVEYVLAHYELGLTEEGAPCAVQIDGPNVALPLRRLRPLLAAQFYERTGIPPNGATLADAMRVIEGRALAGEPAGVSLRLARHGDGIVIDLGTADGRCVLVRPGHWKILGRSPVPFRRTKLTLPIPVPVPGRTEEGLHALRGLINAEEREARLIVGWMVTALVPDIARTVLLLTGEQGTAKSSLARTLVTTLDPTPAPTQSEPRDIRQWVVSANSSSVVCVDNLSTIPGWLSDAMCRAVTGEAMVDRQYYTNEDVSVQQFRRALILTSVDPGHIAGDLAERLMTVELQRIAASRRRDDEDLAAAAAAARPLILGAVLDLLASTLLQLPQVTLATLPRMASAARYLAALDQVTGWSTLPDYLSRCDSGAADVVASSPVAEAVRRLVAAEGEWTGSATELLAVLARHAGDPLPKSWPKDSTRLSGTINRLAPALRQLGLAVESGRAPDRSRRRTWTLAASM
ncbi:ATP-binding protein [Kutzneria viridogrisea]|uniref:ATP-binding protein n=1 Tax=Kutzneria viridogrisea TaxID=47990 RepID=A0ABR6BS06_9PSEU|nr:hypothetical protein [Kutzneria viridogrisea]